MNHLKCTLLVFSAALLTACGKNENIVGKWMQTVPGLPELKQGFVLEADGKASSVNMATLSYKAWQQEGAFLILSGKSVGNHQVLPFSDTLHIEKLTQDSLKLINLKLTFCRKKKLLSLQNKARAALQRYCSVQEV